MRIPLRFSLRIPFAIFGALALASGAGSANESKERFRAGQRELKKARESLHEAQRELAAKTERIEELEAQLKQAERRRAPEPAKAQGKPLIVATPEEKQRVKEKARPAAVSVPASRSFTVQYERNTAVNYEGREAALHWLRGRLNEEGGPQGFHIVGWANESKYPEVNELIATNRARYLTEFLKISGIPEDVILSVSGKRSSADDKNGRRTELSDAAGIPRSGGADGSP